MKILLVDDEKNILESVGGALSRSGYRVVTAGGFHDALSSCDETIDMALIDVWLNDGDGVELLAKFKKNFPDLITVMISGHSTIATAVEAVKRGAYDFLEKPLSLDKLEVVLQNISELISIKKQRDELLGLLESEYKLIGNSPAVENLRQTILKFAPEEAPVFISGESGTGKELVARLIYQNSSRRNDQFIAVNCAALPNELAESELFGYEKGAFTGAIASHPGHFRRAGDGIIFLDEITEASLPLQAKLLRVIEEKKVTPLGSKQEYTVNARVLSASNKNPEKEIKAGRFRQDLYFRLNVLPVNVPPLRDRVGDLKILVEYFCSQYSIRTNKKPIKISVSAIKILEKLNFPGNIRELKNYIERILILTEDNVVGPEELQKILPTSINADLKHNSNLKLSVAQFEKEFIIKTIKNTGNNIAKAARVLGLERSHLYKKMKSLNIDKDNISG